jgi:hypothetical protein
MAIPTPRLGWWSREVEKQVGTVVMPTREWKEATSWGKSVWRSNMSNISLSENITQLMQIMVNILHELITNNCKYIT